MQEEKERLSSIFKEQPKSKKNRFAAVSEQVHNCWMIWKRFIKFFFFHKQAKANIAAANERNAKEAAEAEAHEKQEAEKQAKQAEELKKVCFFLEIFEIFIDLVCRIGTYWNCSKTIGDGSGSLCFWQCQGITHKWFRSWCDSFFSFYFKFTKMNSFVFSDRERNWSFT